MLALGPARCCSPDPRPITHSAHQLRYGRCVVLWASTSSAVGSPGSGAILTGAQSSPSSASSSMVSPSSSGGVPSIGHRGGRGLADMPAPGALLCAPLLAEGLAAPTGPRSQRIGCGGGCGLTGARLSKPIDRAGENPHNEGFPPAPRLYTARCFDERRTAPARSDPAPSPSRL